MRNLALLALGVIALLSSHAPIHARVEQFVAVGEKGTILTSLSGWEWTSRNSGTGLRLRAIAAKPDLLMAVGESGTVVTSTDGETWSPRNVTNTTLRGVASNRIYFIAVGGHEGGVTMASEDGVTWTYGLVPVGTGNLRAVAWGNSIFVTVGTAGTVLTGADGVNWTLRNLGGGARLDGVWWTGSAFRVVSETGASWTSPDGNTWTSAPALAPPGWVEAAAWNEVVQVVVGANGTAQGTFDGSFWRQNNRATSATLHGVAWTGPAVAPSTDLAAALGTLASAPFIQAQPPPRINGIVGATVSLNYSVSGSAPVTFKIQRNGVDVTTPATVSGGSVGHVLSNLLYSAHAGEYRVVLSNAAGQTASVETRVEVQSPGPVGSQFVAVGGLGTILTSPDGQTWTRRISNTGARLRGVATNTQRLIAVGDGVILISLNGETWSVVTNTLAHTLRGVTSAGDHFVAVGGSRVGQIMGSYDGSSWYEASLPAGVGELRAVAYGNGVYVAVGDNGTVLFSSDASTWTTVNAGTSARLDAVWWTGTQFQIYSAAGYLISSPNGILWSHTQAVAPPPWVEAATWSDQRYIAVGAGGMIKISPDGVSWTVVASGVPSGIFSGTVSRDLHAVVWTGATRVPAVDPAVALTHLVGSPTITSNPREITNANVGDTVTFMAGFTGAAPLTYQWRKEGQAIGSPVAATNTATVAFSPVLGTHAGTYDVKISNGSGSATSASVVLGVRGYGPPGSQFVAVGQGGVILTSPDGVVWTPRVSGTVRRLRAVAANALRFMAVGEAGTILTSPDGITWTAGHPGLTETFRGVAAGPDRFCIVGGQYTGYMLTTANGMELAGISLPIGTGRLRAAAWGGGVYLAVGENGTIVRSTDSWSWSKATSGTNARLDGVWWTGSQFQVVTQYGEVLTSQNGVAWTNAGTATPPSGLEGLAWSGDCYVVVGADGLIRVSTNGTSWADVSGGGSGTLHGVTWSGTPPIPVGAPVAFLNHLGDPVVQPSGFSLWLAGRFTSGEMADPAVSGPNADPDGDGYSNLLEYALGLEPKSPSSTGLPEVSTTSTDWVYTFTRPADREELTYLVEGSVDLGAWSTNNITLEFVSSAGGMETWRARHPLTGTGGLFFRLKVIRP